jgi:prepilin-type N-terminal cleavage/methylation domain-containing protein
MNRGSAGFTLLEMVVSLSILAAIAAFLVAAFRLAGSSIERGEAAAREMARLRAGIGIFERSIRSADPTPLSDGDGKSPYFLGEAKKIRFFSSSSVYATAGGGGRLLCFFGEEGTTGGTGISVSDASPFRADGPGAWSGTENSRMLLAGATEVRFSFSPGPTDEGKWEWAESWDSREREGLPGAVRVEYVTQSEGGSLRNAFVVPVMAGGA